MSFRDRLIFDSAHGEYRDGDIRYMMIRPDALMGILAELPASMRPEFLAAFARSITRHGGRSAQAYRAAGAVAPAQMVATIAETAPQLGWGVWDLRHSTGALDLTVRNSPFVAGHGPAAGPVCHPILGMLRAVGPMVLGCDVVAAETQCAATGHAACRFSVMPLAGGNSLDLK
jgi:predicted hydrocarbon binding protein